MNIKLTEDSFPGLYKISDLASRKEQANYYAGIWSYLVLLILAALFSYYTNGSDEQITKIFALAFFLITLSITIWLKVKNPDGIWYNGRAVAESVKTRSWRFMMKAEPYQEVTNEVLVRKKFINDLKTILKQNEELLQKVGIESSIGSPITETMINIRDLSLTERYRLYLKERVSDQSNWYTKKAKYNKSRSRLWFWFTIGLHIVAIALLVVNIIKPKLSLPIEVLAVCASCVVTWVQTKKHDELSSSYALTAHEIALIQAENPKITNEEELSDYILNCENAFSREHTQWFARKTSN